MEDYKNKDWLTRQYSELKRSCDEIGIEQERDPKTIWSWVKKFNIPTRKRGAESSGGTFSKGHKKGVGRVHTQETKEKLRQARIKDGHVPYLKNGIHWLKSEGAISPMWKGGITPERQAVYSSIEWGEVVKKVWVRDNATCQKCGKHQSSERHLKFHIHHIVSFANKELRCDFGNLILLCYQCHKWVHSKKNTNKQFIKQ